MGLEDLIAKGIWRQKRQEAALKLFIAVIIAPAIIIAIIVYNSPTCQHKALLCPDAPARGAPK